MVALPPHFLSPFLIEVLLDGCLVIARLLARTLAARLHLPATHRRRGTRTAAANLQARSARGTRAGGAPSMCRARLYLALPFIDGRLARGPVSPHKGHAV